MQARQPLISVLLIATTIAAGLMLRLAPLGLPAIATKYGGSILWALMIYWIVSTLRHHWKVARCALVSAGIALSVELLKLYHTPALDAFRLTLAGQLLLGRFFSGWDLLAYAVGVCAGVSADSFLRNSPATAAVRQSPYGHPTT